VIRKPIIALFFALSICVVGHGIARVPAQSTTPAAHRSFQQDLAQWRASKQTLSGTPARATTLPTVTVSATVPPAHAADSSDSVMVDDVVDNARAALGRQFDAGIRRVNLAFPYYAFGASSRRATD
jgi:hypothetical protein